MYIKFDKYIKESVEIYDLLIIKFNHNLDYIQFNNTFQDLIDFEYQKDIGKTDNNKYGIIILTDDVKNISGKILNKYKLYATSINFVENGKLENNFKNYNISPIFNSRDVNKYNTILKNNNIKESLSSNEIRSIVNDTNFYLIKTYNKEFSRLVERYIIDILRIKWHDNAHSAIDEIYNELHLQDDEGLLFFINNRKPSLTHISGRKNIEYFMEKSDVIEIRNENDLIHFKQNAKIPSYKPRKYN